MSCLMYLKARLGMQQKTAAYWGISLFIQKKYTESLDYA